VITVRAEASSDHGGVRRLNRLAFPGPVEAALVDAVRGSPGCVSLVATAGRRVVGHILFTPVRVVGPAARARAVGPAAPVEVVGPAASARGADPAAAARVAAARVAGLGPMAVLPDRQRRGIGSRLVRAGLDACRHLGYEAVVVVGHPAYYPRFGFSRAGAFGLRFESAEVPDEAFMALELRPGALAGGGRVLYLPEFSKV
jgi:putative acetyltransferase